MQECGPKAWEDPPSRMRCHPKSASINHLLKALKDTVFLFQPNKTSIWCHIWRGVFTRKHLLVQRKSTQSNLAATPPSTQHLRSLIQRNVNCASYSEPCRERERESWVLLRLMCFKSSVRCWQIVNTWQRQTDAHTWQIDHVNTHTNRQDIKHNVRVKRFAIGCLLVCGTRTLSCLNVPEGVSVCVFVCACAYVLLYMCP